jgi:hypothetical protein
LDNYTYTINFLDVYQWKLWVKKLNF